MSFHAIIRRKYFAKKRPECENRSIKIIKRAVFQIVSKRHLMLNYRRCELGTIIDLMLRIRERHTIFYHKDTNQFDNLPYSEPELKNMSFNDRIPIRDLNNYRLPSYEEIDHEDIMRFYVREVVEDKGIRKQLFDILRRNEYVDIFLHKLRELNLYDDFINACGDIYIQIFEEWADKNDLNFK